MKASIGISCHRSFAGRGGFQLSLFCYDFDKDIKGDLLLASINTNECIANSKTKEC